MDNRRWFCDHASPIVNASVIPRLYCPSLLSIFHLSSSMIRDGSIWDNRPHPPSPSFDSRRGEIDRHRIAQNQAY